MAKSLGEKAVNATQTAMALKRIINAFLKGGWKAAALETVKHYWPYILVAVLVLLFLPLLIVFSLPSTSSVTMPAIEQYDLLFDSRVDELCKEVYGYEYGTVYVVGQPMKKNEIYAAALVLSGNDTKKVTEGFLYECINDSVVSVTVMDKEDTKIEALEIHYLTIEEFLRSKGKNDADIEWANLILKDFEQTKEKQNE